MKFWPFGRKKAQALVADPCTELPVPTHLKPFFVPMADKNNTTQITGSIRCTCGCEAFAAQRSVDNDCLFRLNCDACVQEVLLFDARRHGWDSVVCHEPVEAMQMGESTARCEKCGREHFGVTVWIEPTEKAEFVSCVEGELPDGEWVNAFTWFAAHLTCTHCGYRQRDWADVETA